MSHPAPSTTVTVNLSNAKSYDIIIADHSLAQLGVQMVQQDIGKKSKKVLVVSNPVIFKHYGQTVTDSLTAAGFDVATVILPAGERFKTANSLQKIYDGALHHRLERSSTMVALGGGVVGDMTGYAAATWLRGLAVVQVPTTLLAMVDSAIGGKTGINHPLGKNLIGAFHQPALVWVDPTVLQTLPAREFRAAMAEVIKYGVIWDGDLFAQLTASKRLDQVRYVPQDLLHEIIHRCAQAKATVVSRDEKESNLRAILNYGHTIGHAIEMATNYRTFNHGEAVGLGMIAAGAIAVGMGWWTEADQKSQIDLIAKAKLPCTIAADLDEATILNALTIDKKVEAGKVRFILPKAIGTVEITDAVTDDLLQLALDRLKSSSYYA
ncbi:MAG: 3-dehydroquinate synthase [Pseudanabaenaceae cyanobacterium]